MAQDLICGCNNKYKTIKQHKKEKHNESKR